MGTGGWGGPLAARLQLVCSEGVLMSVIDVWAGSVPGVIGRGPVAQGFAPSSQWPPPQHGFHSGAGHDVQGGPSSPPLPGR